MIGEASPGSVGSGKPFRRTGHLKEDALTGVAQLVGHHPAELKVVGSVPGQGICLGYGLVPWFWAQTRGK